VKRKIKTENKISQFKFSTNRESFDFLQIERDY